MKTVFKFALMGFAASLLVLGCSKSDTTPEDNPNYDSEKNVVNANFVFNVSTGNTPITKMTDANTQATSGFLGITNAQLFSYKLASDGQWVATATDANKTYSLGAVLAAGTIDGTKSHKILELALPVGTNALMFWGKAPDGDKNANGKITFSASNPAISNHTFGLVSRVADGSDAATALGHWEDMIVKLINKVVATNFSAAAGAISWNSQTNTDAINVNWSDYATVTGTAIAEATASPIGGGALLPSEEILSKAFVAFNKVAAGEVRAGSGADVIYMMSQLYNSIHKLVDDAQYTPTSFKDYVVTKKIAKAIEDNLLLIVTNAGAAQAIGTLQTNAGVSYTDVTGDLANFPANLDLPNGAVQLDVTLSATAPVATWAYKYGVTTIISGATGVNSYMYPAELCYFGNSPIRVTDEEVKANEYPDGVTNWDTDGSWTSKNWEAGKHVLSSTRSVAMQYNINYGTALLKTNVLFDAATLQDNNQHFNPTEPNKEIDAATGKFTLTGILVGGQAKEVGWDYLPKANTFSYTIYDKAIVSTAVPTTDPTYTLVWDNYNSTLTGDQQEVLVALEFTNNAGDFWGKDNLVRNGGTFYLVGKLNPSGKTISNWPDKYALPPYTNGTTIKEVVRVFIQDYVTTANFKFDATSLQKAYVTVPDLRSTQVSLGLSVDLTWTTGLVFDSILGAD